MGAATSQAKVVALPRTNKPNYQTSDIAGIDLTFHEAATRALTIATDPAVAELLGPMRGLRGPISKYRPLHLVVATLTCLLTTRHLHVRQTRITATWNRLIADYPHHMQALSPVPLPKHVGKEATSRTLTALTKHLALSGPGQELSQGSVTDDQCQKIALLLEQTLLAASTTPVTVDMSALAMDSTIIPAWLAKHSRVPSTARRRYATPTSSHQSETQMGWDARIAVTTNPATGCHVSPTLVVSYRVDAGFDEGGSCLNMLHDLCSTHVVREVKIDRGVNSGSHAALDPGLAELGIRKVTVPRKNQMGIKQLGEHVVRIDATPYIADILTDPDTRATDTLPMIGHGPGDRDQIAAEWEYVITARDPYRLTIKQKRASGVVMLGPVKAGRAVCVHSKTANRRPLKTGSPQGKAGRKWSEKPFIACTETGELDRHGRPICTANRTYTLDYQDLPVLSTHPYGSRQHTASYGQRALVESFNGVLRTQYGWGQAAMRTANQAKATVMMGLILAAYNVLTIRNYHLKRAHQDPWSEHLGAHDDFEFTRSGARRKHAPAA